MGILGAGALAAVVAGSGRGRGATDEPGATSSESTVCRLPQIDRPQRTLDFRTLFDGGLVDRQRSEGAMRWILRSTPKRLAESRRLASLEERCCDGIRFQVIERGDQIHWEITGPASALRTLDALYELPFSVQDDEQAARLWASLDAASCGPGK